MLHLLGVVDIGVVALRCVGVACQRLRVLAYPSHDDGLDVAVDCPLQPLVCVWFAHSQGDDAVAAMRLEVVAHAIRTQVACKEYYAVWVY